jgi:hypothetical protein
LRCPKCRYVWEYKGKNPLPRYMSKVFKEGQYSQVQGRVGMSLGNEGLPTLTIKMRVSPESVNVKS